MAAASGAAEPATDPVRRKRPAPPVLPRVSGTRLRSCGKTVLFQVLPGGTGQCDLERENILSSSQGLSPVRFRKAPVCKTAGSYDAGGVKETGGPDKGPDFGGILRAQPGQEEI